MESNSTVTEGAIADISVPPVPPTPAPRRHSVNVEVEPTLNTKSRFTVTKVNSNEILGSRFTVTKVEEFPRSKSISSSTSEEFHDVPESTIEIQKLQGRDIFRDVEFRNSPPVSSDVWFNLLDSFSHDSSETIESSDSFESAADVLETFAENEPEAKPPSGAAELHGSPETIESPSETISGDEVNLTEVSELFRVSPTNNISTSAENESSIEKIELPRENLPSSTKIDVEMRRAKSPPSVPPRPKHLNKRYGMMAYLNLPLSRRIAPILTGQRLARSRRRTSPRCTSQPELRSSGEESVTLHVNLVCESNRTSPALTGELAEKDDTEVGHCYFHNIKSTVDQTTFTSDAPNRLITKHTDENIKTDSAIQPSLTAQSDNTAEKDTRRKQELNGSPSGSLQKPSTSSEETFDDEFSLTNGPSMRAIIQRSAAYPKTPPSSPRPPRRAIALQRRAQGEHGVARGGAHSDTVGAVRRRLATALAAASAMRNLTTARHRRAHTPEPEVLRDLST
ncbi:hypothetical protein B566_EDAN004294 [Ephemera danica]|nr:hypothetical protein B566_EDAN004294 [Ephemera danica]